MRIQNFTPQYNYMSFKGNLTKEVTQRVVTDTLQKSVKCSAKAKTGAAAAITALFLAFINLFKRAPKVPETKVETPKAVDTPKPIVEKPKLLEPTKENFEMLEKKLNEYICYEKEIGYSNIEILQNVPEEQRKRIISYLSYHSDDAKNFIAFAAGEASGVLLCVDSNCHNVFLSLEDARIDTSNFVWDSGGELIVDRKASDKIIKDNLDFFRIRLGLPVDATVEDVKKEILCCTYNSPLRNKNKSADLMQLLLGNDIYDACHAQIVKDLKKTKGIFYAGCANNLEEYKTILKKSVLSKNSSYSEMPQSFKEDLIKAIDNITEEAFRSRIDEPIEFLREPKSELEKFRSLERLVQKLEKAQKEGTTIKFEAK